MEPPFGTTLEGARPEDAQYIDPPGHFRDWHFHSAFFKMARSRLNFHDATFMTNRRPYSSGGLWTLGLRLLAARFPVNLQRLVSLLFLVALLGSLPVAARQDTASEQGADQIASRLAADLSSRYDAIEGMRLRFVQTASSAFMDTDERYSGLLTFTDNEYLIETSNQTIVTDGTTTWVHNRGEGQVIINDFVEDETAFSLTRFLRSFSDEYRSAWEGTESLGGIEHDRLRLIPTDDFADFRQVDLWIRRSDTLVTRLIAVDLNDVRMVFDLSAIEVNPDLPEDLFVFEMPDNAEIVDLREEG